MISTLHCKLKKISKNTTNSKLDFESLYKPEIRRDFTIQVMNIFKSIEDEGTELTWELLKDTLVEAVETKIPKRKTKPNQMVTEEILNLMRQTKIKNRQGDCYKELDNEIKRTCDETKEA